MKTELAITKNVAATNTAFLNLKATNLQARMGLLHGLTGYGKTSAIRQLAYEAKAVFITTTTLSTKRSILTCILQELGLSAVGTLQRSMDYVVENLIASERPLFVDEINYLVEDARKMQMLDLLRDIHDLAQVPVLMIGHQGTEQRVLTKPQLSGRISQNFEFAPLDVDDTVIMSEALCECEVEQSILERLCSEAKGSARLIASGLWTVETFAKANTLTKVCQKEWGKRPFGFLTRK